jgi:protein-S-isoprenylcysteine O-methyltransferase Ste14
MRGPRARPGWIGQTGRWDAQLLLLIGRIAGTLIFLVGLALFAWCVDLFGHVGRGTLAPWDPTRRLVAAGPCEYVRNPMILGVVTTLVGEGLFRGSLPLLAWAALFFLINHLYSILSEEPGLERRFGAEYAAYRAHVPRWLPRLRTSDTRGSRPA